MESLKYRTGETVLMAANGNFKWLSLMEDGKIYQLIHYLVRAKAIPVSGRGATTNNFISSFFE